MRWNLEDFKAALVRHHDSWQDDADPADRMRLVEADLRGLDLRGLDLSSVELFSCDLDGCQLDSANFQRAWLNGSSFAHASLVGADFFKAELTETDFTGADLRHARFQRNDAVDTVFRNAQLEGAVLSDSAFTHCDFSGADLRRAAMNSTSFDAVLSSDLDATSAVVSLVPGDVVTIGGRELPAQEYLASRGATVVPRVLNQDHGEIARWLAEYGPRVGTQS